MHTLDTAYDVEADAALKCLDASDKIKSARETLRLAEQELYAANLRYVEAHVAVVELEKGFPK